MSRDTDYSTLFNQLLEVDGPFLTAAVAKKAFGKILPKAEQVIVDEMRVANAERATEPNLNKPWIRWVFERVLDFDDEVLKHGPAVAHLNHLVGQHAVTLRPDFVLDDPDAEGLKPRLLITEWPTEQQLDRKAGTDRWNASPVARMVELCRAMKVPLGLVTNGRSWTLVHAPLEEAVSTTTWDAELWLDERETLDLFITVLGVQRFFGVDESETLESLLADSAKSGVEVTTTLGRQVRRSVELLVAGISEANRERHGELLGDPAPEEIYRGAVTVMMRLVFLLTAEERELLLLGDETYDAHYAVSTLLDQLEDEPDTDVLFNRHDAWPRLLATFRLIHGGVRHDDRLNLPAYGGRLFDPDRYPFLEGRHADEPFDGTNIDDRLLKAINNRVMMAVLRSLQWVELKGESRRLSFRHLDVEQIGTVYEGLLDHSCSLVSDTTLGLLAKKSTKGNIEPEILLTTLEAKRAEGDEELEKWLKDEHKFSATELNKLAIEPEGVELTRLRSACANNEELFERVKPFFGLLRADLRRLPEVFLKDSYVVVSSSERSDTGAHYTPRSIAERIVKHALDPLVYEPGPHNEEDNEKWQLRPWAEIIDLKIVDPACGSGAMLVSACRYLGDRTVEAWHLEEVEGGVPLPLPGAEGAPLVLSTETEEWTVEAMRLVAGRCLYGVDINDMAVEMCKLSLWLTTLAKGKPFSFLDHSIRHGDSLIGIADLGELSGLGKSEKGMGSAYLEGLRAFVEQAKDKRLDLLSMPTVDAMDLHEKSRLLAETDSDLTAIRTVANSFIGALLSTANGNLRDRRLRLSSLADEIAASFGFDGSVNEDSLGEIEERAMYWLNEGRQPVSPDRVPLHWPIEFPEVMAGRGGFDASVSNPPFLGGTKISPRYGTDYRQHLAQYFAGKKTDRADLVCFFYLRAAQIRTSSGVNASVATSSLSETGSREVALGSLFSAGEMALRAESRFAWPGLANTWVCLTWLCAEDRWTERACLDGRSVSSISPSLTDDSKENSAPLPLPNQPVTGYGGVKPGNDLFAHDRALVDPNDPCSKYAAEYLGGKELNESPRHRSDRIVLFMPAQPSDEDVSGSLILQRLKEARSKKDAWWRFDRRAAALMNALQDMNQRVGICLSEVSQHVVWARIPLDDVVPSNKLIVVPSDSMFVFGVLMSDIHRVWTFRWAQRQGSSPSYTPSRVLETFPFPSSSDLVVERAHALEEIRRTAMENRELGLTSLYKKFHDPAEGSDDLDLLRKAQVGLDCAVVEAYGWNDIVLEHTFVVGDHSEIPRFGLTLETSQVILRRLSELNISRSLSQVAADTFAMFEEVPVEPDGTLF